MPEDGILHTPYIKKRFNEFTLDPKNTEPDISLKESNLNTSSIMKSKSVDALSKKKKTKKKSMEEKSKTKKENEDDLCEDKDENQDDNLNDTKDTSVEIVEKKPINYTRSDSKPEHWRRIFINLHHTR